jgi:hypothetical protein
LSAAPADPPGSRSAGINVPTVGDNPIAPVYAIRNPADLECVAKLTPPRSPQPLGQYLLARGLVTEEDLKEALAMQRAAGERRIGWIVKTLGMVEGEVLNRVLAAHSGLPWVYLGAYRPRLDLSHLLPAPTAREHGMTLLHEDLDTAWLAVTDLAPTPALREVTEKLGKRVAKVMTTPADLIKYLDRDKPAPPEMDKATRAELAAQEARRRYLLAAGLPTDSPGKHQD